MKCPGGPAPPASVPATANGNILMGPCTGPSPGQTQNYGDPGNQYRGFLLAGLLYFHQCNASGTGTLCSAPGSGGYGTALSLQGGSGAGAYTVGNVVADTLSLGGNSGINMILNPSNSFTVLKVQVLE
jgi:hypothetical protein